MIENYISSSLKILPYGINLIDILILIILILIITHIIGSIKRKSLSRKIDNIPGYDINTNLINDILEIKNKLDILNKSDNQLNDKIINLQNKSKDILNIKTIKYNPYRDMGVGGNQSFSTAMIDKNGNGIILTNLYSRERTRVLLKEIQNFSPLQELAPEEKEVLKIIKN